MAELLLLEYFGDDPELPEYIPGALAKSMMGAVSIPVRRLESCYQSGRKLVHEQPILQRRNVLATPKPEELQGLDFLNRTRFNR